MTDVVPELLSEIETAFKSHNMTDRKLATVSKRIRDGTATQVDGHTYAERLGKNASKALQDVLIEENLPDGKLYYNIATRTVIPTLENNQALINEAATEIQKNIDKKSKIYLNSVKPSFPAERINGLIDKMTAEGITLEDALVWIREPIVNNSEAFFDDFIRENAQFRSNAGIKTTITRIAEYKACDWCKDLEGTYEYDGDTMPEDIFRRHEFCRCAVTVTYKRQKESQNVWTKKSWKSSEEELARRVDTKPQTMTVQERKNTLERLEKDRLVQQLVNAGKSREYANRIINESPAKVAKILEEAKKRRR